MSLRRGLFLFALAFATFCCGVIFPKIDGHGIGLISPRGASPNRDMVFDLFREPGDDVGMLVRHVFGFAKVVVEIKKLHG